MVNEGFHALLHRSTWRWNQFVIIHLNWSGWNLVQALTKTASVARKLRVIPNYTYLADNPQRFSKFLDSTEVSVITITVLADGNIELDLGRIRINKYKV
jgi:hypothetical protein